MTRERFQPGGWDIVLSVGAMTTLAIAQPLLDLVGKSPGFFLARAAPPIDIVGLAVILGLAIPLLVGGVVRAICALLGPAGRTFHFAVMALLGSVLALTILRSTQMGGGSAWLVLGLAVAIGIGSAWAYYRFAAVRTGWRFASVAPIVVTAAFLLMTPTSRLVWEAESKTEPFSAVVGNPAPVVMVVFDELPVASIIDQDGDVQGEFFPNFARLAEDGTWFRNAVGLHQRTLEALPTIVSGVVAPAEGRVPSATDYPQTIFSLLEGTYEVRAVETVTEMCPDNACQGGSRQVPALLHRWRALASDLTVVYGHLILPSDLSDGLPPVDQNWGDFGGVESETSANWGMRDRIGQLVRDDRRTDVSRYLEYFDQPIGEAEFYFSHVMFPHWPWIHLPDGRLYAESASVPGHGKDGWSSDDWLVEQGYQRHLLQVQYADSIIGEIIERLERSGSYDQTLIVVMADHGGAVRPNIAGRRRILPETVGDIAAIPMFIKRPQSESAGIDDYRAETIDVLPTIADVLDVRIPWQVDGVSLFADERPPRSESTMLAAGGAVTFGTSGLEKLEVARYHLAYAGERGPFGIAPKGYEGLLGEEISELTITEHSEDRVAFDHPEWYADVDGDADFIPALLTGTVVGDLGGGVVLAVAVNDRIEAVTRTWVDGEHTRFHAVLPPESLNDGINEVEVLIVGSPDDLRLSRLAPAA